MGIDAPPPPPFGDTSFAISPLWHTSTLRAPQTSRLSTTSTSAEVESTLQTSRS